MKSIKLEVSKLRKDFGKIKQQQQNLRNEILDRKKTADSLDTMNTELREGKRNLKATCNQLSETLAMMTAKCQSLQSLTSTLNPLAIPYINQDISLGNLTKTTATQHIVRPKVKTTVQDPIRSVPRTSQHVKQPHQLTQDSRPAKTCHSQLRPWP